MGTRTADGVEHTVDRAILAAGANSDLLFDFERQLRPTVWTLDRLILIDRHPKYTGLVLAVGGSGNGFMTMLAVGVLVADASEGVMERRLRKMLRWTPDMAGRGCRIDLELIGR